MDETGQAYSHNPRTPHTLLNTSLVLSEKKPAASSSQIKNADTSRIDLSTDDYDKRLLWFFTWKPLLGIAEIYLLYFFV